MSFPPHPQSPPPPAAAQATGKRRLRKGYIASLVSLTTTLVVFAVLLVLGPYVRQPAPDFMAEPSLNLDVELELGEEHLGELGIYGLWFGPSCNFTNPAGGPGKIQMRGAASFDYGAEEWDLVHVVEITETGTHRITCYNEDVEFGVASMHVVETAQTRQRVWVLTWIGLPLIGLVTTVTIAAVTFVRARRERAAAPVSG
jgi:hypothetical protein